MDFSPKAVAAARALAADLDLPARFVESDIDRLPERLEGEFDIVYTGWGVKAWLPDLRRWAEVIARFLRPGGRFHLLEIHPFTHVLEEGGEEPRVVNPYFVTGPRRFETRGATYATGTGIRQDHNYEWTHSLGDIFTALLGAGLRIEGYRELPRGCYPQFPWLEKRDDGWWHIPDRFPNLPLTFALRAVREE